MKQKRKIPNLMFSQHPDHAGQPYWLDQAFITASHELEESYRMYSEFGAHEVMWDWEGKIVDEAVVDRLLGSYAEFFSSQPLGKELFLTFRIPNPRVESGYRLARAFMVILSAQELARSIGIKHNPLFEVILPMTESAKEMIQIQKNFQHLAGAAKHSFGIDGFNNKPIEIIPLFESVNDIMSSSQILKQFIALHQHTFKQEIKYMRPFFARSDPALNSGVVPTVLAIKQALSNLLQLSRETGIEMYPIIGPGSLPFRGGLQPENPQEFLDEFPGTKTVLIQSAFRYDYPEHMVKESLQLISQHLKETHFQSYTELESKVIKSLISTFEQPYQATIHEVAPLVQQISTFIPKRRERVQHIGLFGYSRQVGKSKLPRAIGYTGSCYSLGIPPELFGTGRGLAAALEHGCLGNLENIFPGLRHMLLRAGRYVNKQAIDKLDVASIKQDVNLIEQYLGEELGPQTDDEYQHLQLTEEIVEKLLSDQNPSYEIEQAAVLRRSLG